MFAYYLTLAWRRAKAAPLVVVLAVLSLAVGQAASLMTLALRHALAGDPIPSKSSRLLTLAVREPQRIDNRFSYADAMALSRLGGGGVITGQGIGSIALPDHSKAVDGAPIRYTTWQFFDFFDAPIARGRHWGAFEDAQAAPVAVLGSRLAKHLFPGADATGRSVMLGQTTYRIVGVVSPWDPAPRFYDLSLGAYMVSDAIYLPLSTIRYAPENLGVPMTCKGEDGAGVIRPRDLPHANCSWLIPWFLGESSEIPDLRRTLLTGARSMLPDPEPGSRFVALDVRQLLQVSRLIPGSVTRFTALALAFLLLCIVNATGMELSRLLKRSSETGIRRALGAKRSDILAQHLVDASLLGGASAVVGTGLTWAGMLWLRHLPSFYTRTVRVDLTVAAWMVVLMIACCLLIGLLPGWVASRIDPSIAIKAQP